MRKILFTLFLTAVCAWVAQAQDKPRPNLDGKWIVDLAKSERTSNFFEDSEVWVTIEQHEPEIRMTRKFESITPAVPLVYYTDGRDASSVSPGSTSTVKTKAKWDGDKLVIHFTGARISANKVNDINII